MDKKLEMYLKSLFFDEEDIENFEILCPALEFISSENAFKCIKAVVNSGFPESEIDSLIFSNPGFLTKNPEEIKKILSKVSGDIEEILKANPDLI